MDEQIIKVEDLKSDCEYINRHRKTHTFCIIFIIRVVRGVYEVINNN